MFTKLEKILFTMLIWTMKYRPCDKKHKENYGILEIFFRFFERGEMKNLIFEIVEMTHPFNIKGHYS